MNQRTSYEIIIAGKLEALPIPDMADQIWDRIKGQLDIDMPTDDDLPGPDGGSPVIRGIGWGALIFIGALITIFFLGRNKQEAKPSALQSREPVKIEQPIPAGQPPTSPINTIRTTIDKPPGRNQGIPISTDSAYSQEPTQPNRDSNMVVQQPSITENPIPETVLPSSDSTVKKKRGVSGLKDSDYKIVPKKEQ